MLGQDLLAVTFLELRIYVGVSFVRNIQKNFVRLSVNLCL